MYPGRSIDGDESGIGNLLLVAVMYHVLIHQLCKPRGTRISTRKIMFARARTLNMYLNIVRCLSIKLLVHECRRITAPMPDDARMEMSKFSAARKQSRDTRARRHRRFSRRCSPVRSHIVLANRCVSVFTRESDGTRRVSVTFRDIKVESRRLF